MNTLTIILSAHSTNEDETECSETSAHKILDAPGVGDHPKENTTQIILLTK
jgi:hypothetical protein